MAAQAEGASFRYGPELVQLREDSPEPASDTGDGGGRDESGLGLGGIARVNIRRLRVRRVSDGTNEWRHYADLPADQSRGRWVEMPVKYSSLEQCSAEAARYRAGGVAARCLTDSPEKWVLLISWPDRTGWTRTGDEFYDREACERRAWDYREKGATTACRPE